MFNYASVFIAHMTIMINVRIEIAEIGFKGPFGAVSVLYPNKKEFYGSKRFISVKFIMYPEICCDDFSNMTLTRCGCFNEERHLCSFLMRFMLTQIYYYLIKQLMHLV